MYYLALVDEAGGFRDIYTDVSEITDWLDARQIGWSLCAGFDEATVWIEGGPGCIFLDIHPELGPEAMEMVEAHFMNAEGEPTIPSPKGNRIVFAVSPRSLAGLRTLASSCAKACCSCIRLGPS
jgi:hypothetical protein